MPAKSLVTRDGVEPPTRGFSVHQLSYLARVAPANLVWHRASMTSALGSHQTRVSFLLTYAQVEYKTETEIWQMLDANTEKHIETVKRSSRSFPSFDH